ncbi:hypothetical protein WI41_13355 [Burkholderia latens]|uniref:Uncharacterized protein n=1 Tax=Burkholderia latens TaxID=488446 RepID=A0AAP1G9V8_9BURK|nr:hypothetical protein WI41_13355 [Burkholderia latens]
MLNQHPQARGQFCFALSTPLRSRSYTRQHDTDWHFVHRLMESEGLYTTWQQADGGKSHTLVIADNLQAFAPTSFSTRKIRSAGFIHLDLHVVPHPERRAGKQ